MPTTNLSIRFSDADLEVLDKLVFAARTYYEQQSETVPAFRDIAHNTNRSSALRHLLRAWNHGQADDLFSSPPVGYGA